MNVQRNPTDIGIGVDGPAVEIVTKFTYLGAIFTSNSDVSTEVKRRICIAKNAAVALSKLWKDRNISLTTKERVLKTLAFPIASYGAECWVLKAADRKRIETIQSSLEPSSQSQPTDLLDVFDTEQYRAIAISFPMYTLSLTGLEGVSVFLHPRY